MNIQIHAKNIDLSLDIREAIEEKTRDVEKYIKNIVDVYVNITRDAHHRKGDVYTVDINVRIPKKTIRATKEGESLMLAFNEAEKVLKQNVAEEKKKMIRKARTSFT